MKVMASRRENRGDPFFSQANGASISSSPRAHSLTWHSKVPQTPGMSPTCPVVPFLALFLDINVGSPLPLILMNTDYCFSLYFPQYNSEPSLLNWVR